MKKIFYLAFFAILFVSCTNSNVISSLTCKGLKGNVKSVTSACYHASERFGEAQKEDLICDSDFWIPLYPGMLWEFDEDGNLLKETAIDCYGDISQVVKYEYKGHNQTSMRIYSGDGTLTYSWETIFSEGKPVSLKRYITNGEVNDQTIECEFEGLCVKSENHYMNGELIETIESEYKNDLHIHSVTKDKDGNITLEEKEEWTDLGQPVYRHYISNGEDAVVEKTIYNEQELPIQYSRTGKWANGEINCTFEYTSFDKQDNWLTRVIKIDNEPVGIQERTIEYY